MSNSCRPYEYMMIQIYCLSACKKITLSIWLRCELSLDAQQRAAQNVWLMWWYQKDIQFKINSLIIAGWNDQRIKFPSELLKRIRNINITQVLSFPLVLEQKKILGRHLLRYYFS